MYEHGGGLWFAIIIARIMHVGPMGSPQLRKYWYVMNWPRMRMETYPMEPREMGQINLLVAWV
jgi:hypothetical protein